MIKIALKHWIYEKCIDVLFEGICRNFAFLNRNILGKIKVGDRFHEILVLDNGSIIDTKYFNAIVTNVFMPDYGYSDDLAKFGFEPHPHIVISGFGFIKTFNGVIDGAYQKIKYKDKYLSTRDIKCYIRA